MSGEFAGTLCERVTIERRADGIDASGGAAGPWTVEATIWASVAPDGFGAPAAADARSARQRYRVTMRARADLGLGHRLQWRGITLAVLSVARDPRAPDRITLMTEEKP